MSVTSDLSKARTLARQGRIAQAKDHYHRVLSKYPRNATALNALADMAGLKDPKARAINGELNRAIARMKAGDPARAMAMARQVERVLPEDLEVKNLIGVLASQLYRFDEAVAAYRAVLARDPGQPVVLVNLGRALLKAGQTGEGLKHLRDAAAREPGNQSLVLAHADGLRSVGDRAAAAKVLEAGLARSPDSPRLLAALSAVRTLAPGDRELDRIEALLARPGLPPGERALLAFAAAEAHDGAGDHDRAFALFRTGNEARRAQLGHDPARDRARFDELRRAFATPIAPVTRLTLGPRPIFVVGMPRSGTTLVERILGSHSQVFGAGELQFFGRASRALLRDHPDDLSVFRDPARLAALRAEYQQTLRDASGGATHVVDKMPGNFRLLPWIAAMFPEAPILHMQRDARAVCWSIFRHNFAAPGMAYGCRLEDVADYYRGYAEMMAAWRELLPGRIADVPYEALTESPEAEARKLVAAAGLEWEEGVLDFHASRQAVRTASVAQVREKLYTGSSEAWRAYAPHLGVLTEALHGL